MYRKKQTAVYKVTKSHKTTQYIQYTYTRVYILYNPTASSSDGGLALQFTHRIFRLISRKKTISNIICTYTYINILYNIQVNSDIYTQQK